MEKELSWEGKDVVLKRGATRIWEGAVRRAMMQEIEHPGTWTRECERLGLVSLPSSSSGNHRMDEFFDPVGQDPSTSLAGRRRSGGSNEDEDEKKRKPGSRPFGDSYPFLLNIKKKRRHVNTGEALDEYQCVFDTARFNVETVNGLTNGGLIDPSDVKPRSSSSAPSSSQPRAGPSSSKAKGKGKDRAPRRVASDPEMEEEEDEDFTRDMEYAIAQSSLAEASHRDGDFQPSGGRGDASGGEDENDDDDEDGSSSPSGKPRSKSKSKPTPPFDPTAPVVLWIPALILQLTHPDKIAEFEEAVASKEQKKADLLAAKAERARVKEAKAEELRQGAGLMSSWVTKGVKPRLMDKGKGKEREKEKEVVRAPSSSSGGSARGGSAAPSQNSSKGSAPPLAEVIEISDDSEDERQAPLPKSPSPKRTTSVRRAPSRLPDLQPVASSSKLPAASSSSQPFPPNKSKPESLHPFPSASSSTSNSDQPHPSKLQKRSPLKRTLSALSASVPDALSDDEFDDGFPLDAFNADPAFTMGTPDRKRRALAPPSTSGAPYSPARRLSPMRSLSPSPATKKLGAATAGKGKEREKDRDALPSQAGPSKSKSQLVKQQVHDLDDSDSDDNKNTRINLGSSTPLAFSSPPPRSKPRSSPVKSKLGSLPPQTSSSSRNKLPPLKSRPDVFSSTTSSSTTSISRPRKPTKPTYVEMDDD